METILSVSDQQAFNQMLAEVKPGNEVVLTKNGYAKYIVSDYAEFKRMQATIKLFSEIQKGIHSLANELPMSIEDLRNRKRFYK